MPAGAKVDKAKVAEVFSPRTKARQSAELDEFDSGSDGEEYIFDDEVSRCEGTGHKGWVAVRAPDIRGEIRGRVTFESVVALEGECKPIRSK